MHTDLRVVFAALCTVCVLTCTAQSTTQKVPKVMNKRMKDSWIDAKSKVFFQRERTPAVTRSKWATFDVEVRKGAFTTIPVTAFVTPSGKTWSGPEQDYYIETDSEIMGFRMLLGGKLLWCSSLAKEPASEVEKQSEKADPSSGFEESVSGSELSEAWLSTDRDARRERSTYLRQGISWWFFTDRPGSSQLGTPKIVMAEINNGQLKMDLIDQAEKYKSSVWIDIKSKKVVKATEIKESVKPD